MPSTPTRKLTPASPTATKLTSLLENPDAIGSAVARLIQPDTVSGVILEGDSMMFGNQASDIDKTTQVKFRKKLCDLKNAHFGGAAKSGPGRFAPFFPSSTIAAIDGPVIIPSGSGWTKFAAGTPNITYWTETIRQTLRHPGSITPAVGTHYAGCYMLFNPTVAHPGAAKWIGLLLNAGHTGTFRVQGRQGASIAVAGSTGQNRFKMAAGAFGGSDMPDPSSATDRVFDVTIDPATMPDYMNYITGHLNSTAMDPTAVWALCIYRVDNAATSVEINAFDAHYDEYTAQNTPRTDGATSVMSFAWPGDTDQGEQGGSASYGTNSDYNQQYTQFIHMVSHSRRYIHAKYAHKMPRAVLAISNEWRNTILNVDNISGTVNPTFIANRLLAETIAYAQAGIAHLFCFDFGASASYLCWGSYFNQSPGNFNSDDYRTSISNTVVALKALKGTRHVGGGLTVLDLDYAFGTGGIDGYTKANMFSSIDFLHWNESGQERVASVLAKVVSGDFNVPKAKPNSISTRTRDPRTLSNRAGVIPTTVLSLDPNDVGTMRYTAVGFVPYGDDASWTNSSIYNGTDLAALTNTIRGTAGEIRYRTELFGERAGLFFDNAANKNNRIVVNLPSLSLSSFTLVFAMQSLWEGTSGSFPNTQGFYLQFGNATDDSQTFTGIYDAWSSGSVTVGMAQGLFGGPPFVLFGNNVQNTVVTVGSHPTQPASIPHDPFIGIVRVNCTAKTITTNISPNQSWQSGSLNNNFPAAFAPTRLSIGGCLGTGAACVPMGFGGLWLLNGLVTDAEANSIFDTLQGESGNWFEQGAGFGDYGYISRPA